MKPFEDILNGTTLKRACCLGKKEIRVKIPIPKDYTGSLQPINKDYNYIEKNVSIPDGVCGVYVPE